VPRTRLHLADPSKRTKPLSDGDIAEIVIHHYLGVTSRIGLWGYRDFLARLARKHKSLRRLRKTKEKTELEDSVTIRFDDSVEIIQRRVGKQDYRGFWYAPQVAMARDAENGTTLGQTLISERQYGRIVFHGLNVRVLKLIRSSRWKKLAAFRDPESRRFRSNPWVFSDGVMKYDREVEAGSDDARLVIAALEQVLRQK